MLCHALNGRKFVLPTIRHLKVFLAFLMIAVLFIGWLFFQNTRNHSYIEKKLVAAIDQQCGAEGECDIDLGKVFADLDWDTVSVFVAGDTSQILELGVYSEISDGIVFLKAGTPVKEHLSCYGFPQDIPPLISYYLDETVPASFHYVTLPREQSVVHAEKYHFYDNSYKYSISAKQLS